MNYKKSIQLIRNKIASGNLNDAIEYLDAMANEYYNYSPNEETSEIVKSVAIQNMRISNLNKVKKNGTGSSDETLLEYNRIASSIIDIVNSIENLPSSSITSQVDRSGGIPKTNKKTKKSTNERTRTIELNIDADFEEFDNDDIQSLLNIIKQLLLLDNDVRINKIRKGSVKLNLEFPESKYEDLLEIFKIGLLDKLNIKDIDGLDKNKIDILEHGNILSRIFKVTGRDITGRAAWYFVLIDEDKIPNFLSHKEGDAYNIEEYGRIIISGYGEEVPSEVIEKYGFNNL